MAKTEPQFSNPEFGNVGGNIEMLPKPVGKKLPLLVTGGSQQSQDWLARNGDGWMTYPRGAAGQAEVLKNWRIAIRAAGRSNQPAMEPLYVDLVKDANAAPTPIHLGLRLGVNHLRAYLLERQSIGVNHVAINLRFNRLDTEETMKRLADELLPEFNVSPVASQR